MDLAIPAAESEAAAAAAAGVARQQRDVARCGDAERPLRLAFRLLLMHLRHAPEVIPWPAVHASPRWPGGKEDRP